MLEALLLGKLSREQENMEDVLTSIVFGTFRKEPVDQGLLPFLRSAEDIIGTCPIFQNYSDYSAEYDKYKFWPSWQGINNVAPCEPDVVIELNAVANKNILVLIEAKYQSGVSSKSSKDKIITHQIAKEWLHLNQRAKERNCTPWLIYLTADIGNSSPKDDIDEAQEEIKKKCTTDETNLTISWLSWRTLSKLFGQKQDSGTLRDLGNLAEHLNLIYFEGIPVLESLPQVQYRFDDSIKFNWDFDFHHSVTWRFIK